MHSSWAGGEGTATGELDDRADGPQEELSLADRVRADGPRADRPRADGLRAMQLQMEEYQLDDPPTDRGKSRGSA